jgi:UDP-N-acetylglucosamine 1-carboxyvinyltransferase
MHKYIINGSYPIKGKIKANGNKNAALPCITATLLSDEPITLHNVPNIEDVQVLFSILEDLGSTVERLGENSYKVQTLDINSSEIPPKKAKAIRLPSFLRDLCSPELERWSFLPRGVM